MNYFDTDKREFAKHFVKYGLIPTDKELPYDASEESAMGEYVHPMKDIERINNQKNKHERNENIQYKTNTNMNKKLIRLTENELRHIISESVKRVLREHNRDIDDDNYFGGGLPDRYFDDDAPDDDRISQKQIAQLDNIADVIVNIANNTSDEAELLFQAADNISEFTSRYK